MTITLGCHDNDLRQSDVDALFERLRAFSGNPDKACLVDDTGDSVDPRRLDATEPRSVAEVQEALSRIGFFPGGRVDGICGYRTRSAIRLFQEYVRSIEGRPCTPDGKFGPATGRELDRWLEGGLTADWSPRFERWNDGTLAEEPGEFGAWLSFLEKVKAHRLETPGPMLEKVDAFDGPSDTRAVADWAFDDREIHLIGVRYGEQAEAHRFDDVLILLIKGLVFAFQGSTDPGSTTHEDGAPFLVLGQHAYRFGLHQGSYHALKPREHGVLVLRSKGDYALTDDDLAGELEANRSINIHWGGRGVAREVKGWSAGCQVVAGSGYRNHAGDVILCEDQDLATSPKDVKATGGRRTRGAYNVLSDLVVALSNDMEQPGGVSYTLLHESDLALDPATAERMAKSREEAVSHFH